MRELVSWRLHQGELVLQGQSLPPKASAAASPSIPRLGGCRGVKPRGSPLTSL